MSGKKKKIPGDFCEINNNIDIPLIAIFVGIKNREFDITRRLNSLRTIFMHLFKAEGWP